jgi:endonuclease YncB( thermonuclease family)
MVRLVFLGLLVALVLGPLAPRAGAHHFEGWARVIRVVDGDTVVVAAPDGLVHTVRLYGLDAPDRGRPGFGEARAFLSDLIFGCARSRFEPLRWCNARPGEVWLEPGPRAVDRYGRSLYYVWVLLELRPAAFSGYGGWYLADAVLVLEGLARCWWGDGQYQDFICSL